MFRPLWLWQLLTHQALQLCCCQHLAAVALSQQWNMCVSIQHYCNLWAGKMRDNAAGCFTWHIKLHPMCLFLKFSFIPWWHPASHGHSDLPAFKLLLNVMLCHTCLRLRPTLCCCRWKGGRRSWTFHTHLPVPKIGIFQVASLWLHLAALHFSSFKWQWEIPGRNLESVEDFITQKSCKVAPANCTVFWPQCSACNSRCRQKYFGWYWWALIGNGLLLQPFLGHTKMHCIFIAVTFFLMHSCMHQPAFIAEVVRTDGNMHTYVVYTHTDMFLKLAHVTAAHRSFLVCSRWLLPICTDPIYVKQCTAWQASICLHTGTRGKNRAIRCQCQKCRML